MQIHAKKGGKKNGKTTMAAMTMLLEGLADGEEVGKPVLQRLKPRAAYCTVREFLFAHRP